MQSITLPPPEIEWSLTCSIIAAVLHSHYDTSVHLRSSMYKIAVSHVVLTVDFLDSSQSRDGLDIHKAYRGLSNIREPRTSVTG
ncbi:hypothetical protein KC318_g26 [Hortaea werneckii]|nr:hypothetical protein KC334_g25 [Hortaea werneckii]KAI7028411.1 hypothetical protein KC355_g27 [Hortaea werneckii]KAI7676758.1 hypothetical protein KC318_g26 [Hortaea werneckii]